MNRNHFATSPLNAKELYKHQYALARWAWLRGITDLEFFNEPDLDGCLAAAPSKWLEMHVLRTGGSCPRASARGRVGVREHAGFVSARMYALVRMQLHMRVCMFVSESTYEVACEESQGCPRQPKRAGQRPAPPLRSRDPKRVC